jgi:hypothetical protein
MAWSANPAARMSVELYERASVISTTGPKYFCPIWLQGAGWEMGNPAEYAAPVCNDCSIDAVQGVRS